MRRAEKGERDEDQKRRKGYKHEAATGYSWVLARTIIDKIELRAGEHRDSGRPVDSHPRLRGGSLCPKATITDGHRALSDI